MTGILRVDTQSANWAYVLDRPDIWLKKSITVSMHAVYNGGYRMTCLLDSNCTLVLILSSFYILQLMILHNHPPYYFVLLDLIVALAASFS